jgi:hypothetical protein
MVFCCRKPPLQSGLTGNEGGCTFLDQCLTVERLLLTRFDWVAVLQSRLEKYMTEFGPLYLTLALLAAGIGLTASDSRADVRATCDIDPRTGNGMVEFHNIGSSIVSCGGYVVYKTKAGEMKCQLHNSDVRPGGRKVHVCDFYGQHNRPIKVLLCQLSCS